MNVRSGAFTLVELLIVVAILSVLASLLSPALNKAMAASELVSCAQQHKTLGVATAMYGDDFDGGLPNSVPNLASQPNNFGSYPTFRIRHDDGQAIGLGLLFETGQLQDSDTRLLFCPSWQGQDRSQYNTHGWFNNLYTEIFDNQKGFSEISSNYKAGSVAYAATENDTYFRGGRYSGKISMRFSDPYYQSHPVLFMDVMRDYSDPNRDYGVGETHDFEKNNLSYIDGSVRAFDVIDILLKMDGDFSNTRNYQHDFTIWDISADL